MSVQQKTNYVQAVMDSAGIAMNSTIGSVTKPGAIAEYAKDSAANIDKIMQVAQATQKGADPSGPSSPASAVSLEIKPPSMMGAMLWTGATIAATVVNPALGAAVGAVATAKEVYDFTTSNAAIDGGIGELTMAAADKKSYAASHPQSTYTDILGEVWQPDGQRHKPQPAQAMDRGIAQAAREVSKDYSEDQIQGDVKKMLEQETKNYAWAQNKLQMLGLKEDPEIPRIAAAPKMAVPSLG